VILCLLTIALMAFAALAVDLGVIASAQSQLKTVTDAAALAGARQLASDRRLSTTLTNLTPEINAAVAAAILAGNANKVLNQSPLLTSSSIVVGYIPINPAQPSASINTSVPTAFNSVQATASIHAPAFFAAIFRSTGSTVTATSTATVQLVQIKGFNSTSSNLPALILPITMDLNAYNNMQPNGTGGDHYSFSTSSYYPPASNGVSSNPDGLKESVAYPVASGLSGNWGTIDFGVSNNSTAILNSQISSGITPAQMAREFPGGTFTLPHQFSANPGISSGIKSSLTDIIGRQITIPIYDTSGGNGNNAWYRVVMFATARVVAVDMSGSNKYVIMQPALNSDPTVIGNNTSPNTWSQGGVVFLRLTR